MLKEKDVGHFVTENIYSHILLACLLYESVDAVRPYILI
jgi:hypothetical protein